MGGGVLWGLWAELPAAGGLWGFGAKPPAAGGWEGKAPSLRRQGGLGAGPQRSAIFTIFQQK